MTTLTKIQGNRIDTEDVASKIMQTSEFTTELNKKQDVITDLADIRSGAAKGETALQSYTETDPTVPSHVKSITEANITSWNNKSDFSGSYEDLTNKPTIPTVNNSTITLKQGDETKGTFTLNQEGDSTIELDAGSSISWGKITGTLTDQTDLNTTLTGKQDKLTAGTGIEITADNVINNTQTSAEWGNITGTLTDQTDLNTALNEKQNTLVSGTNIKTINNIDILGSGNITIEAGSTIAEGIHNKNENSISPMYAWQGTEEEWNNGGSKDWYNWKSGGELGEWTETSLPDQYRWGKIIYNKNSFIALGRESNKTLYSTDGINWSLKNLPAYRLWWTLTYGNDKFIVFVQGSSYIAYSTDGINWSQVDVLPSALNWYSASYGNGKFVAVAYNSNVCVYSEDGITWTQSTLPSTQYWWETIYENNKFITISGGDNYSSNVFAYSTDGINWTQGTLPSSQYWQSITYGNGKYVAISGGNKSSNVCAYSEDGVTWTQGTMPSSSKWKSISYGNGKFVAISYSTNICAYSDDGITWIQGTMSSSSNWYSVAYGNDKFVAVAYNSTVSAYLPVTSALLSYTDTATPTTSSKVYSEPNTESSLTITSVGDDTIVLSDSNTYNRNSSGDKTTSGSIGEAHPDYLSFIDNVGIKLGTDTVIPVQEEKTKLSEFEDDLGSTPVHTHSQYLTEHQSLDNYATKSYVEDYHDSTKQDTSNIVTTLSSESTDTQYPSAKCVYDLVGNIETLLHNINSGE